MENYNKMKAEGSDAANKKKASKLLGSQGSCSEVKAYDNRYMKKGGSVHKCK